MQNKYPKISIITPSYNQVEFIEDTILSVIGQNYPNLEYIIIDGGSSHGSVEIIKEYTHRLVYWISEKDNGQSSAINKGFRKATGKIICWINSDDILLPGALSAVGHYFTKNPDVMFVNGNTMRIDAQSRMLFNNHIMKQNKWFAKHGIFNIAQQSMFWRRELFDRIGYLDESMHCMMDLEFLIRIFESNVRIGQIDRTLAAIRIHGKTKTCLATDNWTQDKIKIRTLYSGNYDNENVYWFYFFLFVVIKMAKLKYLRDIIFHLRWKGKPVKEFSPLRLNLGNHSGDQ